MSSDLSSEAPSGSPPAASLPIENTVALSNIDIMEAKVDGTPFSVLVNQAVKLKNARSAPLRSKFDRHPQFYQNSIFPREEVTQARRCKAFVDRMKEAEAIKQNGNEAFRNQIFSTAALHYEMAVAVWIYLENTNPNWRSEGINDDFIVEMSFESQNEEEKKAVKEFLIKCYKNLALSNLQMKQHSVSIAACNEVLALDPYDAKALFVRAKARADPKSAGAAELSMAIKDLCLARNIDPKNISIAKELSRHRQTIQMQREKDRQTFAGLFQRGQIYESVVPSSTSSKTCASGGIAEHNKQRGYSLQEADKISELCAKRGFFEEEEKLRMRIKEADERYSKKLDFRKPSKQMIQKAKERGIDLHDESVVAMLEELQKCHLEDETQEFNQEKVQKYSSHQSYETLDPDYVRIGDDQRRNKRPAWKISDHPLFLDSIFGWIVAFFGCFRAMPKKLEFLCPQHWRIARFCLAWIPWLLFVNYRRARSRPNLHEREYHDAVEFL